MMWIFNNADAAFDYYKSQIISNGVNFDNIFFNSSASNYGTTPCSNWNFNIFFMQKLIQVNRTKR